MFCYGINWIILFTGKDRDVGEVLVNSLQNTKYSIDEKLEQSFINLFSQKANPLLEGPSDANDSKEYSGQINNVEPMEQNQRSGEESDSEDLDDLDSSDESKTRRVDKHSDANSMNEQALSENTLKEQIEFHEGRMRRSVFVDQRDDEEVMLLQLRTGCHCAY